jgi:hypothetical protein
MTSRDPDGWRLLRRAPQHAAPLGLALGVRAHTHRALKLFVTTGSWAAALCLVAGLIVLVAEIGRPGPSQPQRLASASQADTAGRLPGVSKSPAPRPGPAQHIIATFTGRGNRTTGQFAIRPHQRWLLHWSYNCPGQPGQLIVADSAGAGGASVDQTGLGGAGSTWLTSGQATHYLVVISTCTWTMKAVQAQ